MKHLDATRKNIGARIAPQANRMVVTSALVALCAGGLFQGQAHALTLKAGVKGTILGTTKYPSATGGAIQSIVAAVLGLLSNKEGRAIAEINLKGLKPIKKATLSLKVSALAGVLGTNGLNIGVDAYTGNNKIDVSDYQAPVLGSQLLSTNLAGSILGKTLTVDVTALVNAAIARGDAALGIRVSALSNLAADLGVTLGDISISTIDNSIPTVKSVSLASSTNSPTTNSTLSVNVSASDTDQDKMTYRYVWSKNGVIIPGETKSTLDLSKAGNGDKGDKVTVTVTASDGLITSLPKTSSAITIVNSAPVVGTVSVTPTAPKSNSVLTAKVDASSDADKDKLTTTYQWKRNGGVISGATNATLDLSKVLVKPGDKISAVVIVSDGTLTTKVESAAMTIANSPIKLTSFHIKSEQSATTGVFTTNSTLFAEVQSSDPDFANGGRPVYTFVWSRIRNGNATIVQTDKEIGSTAKFDLSKAGYGDKGDTISLTVTVDDKQGSTDSLTQNVKVANSAPTVTALSLTPTSPIKTSTLIAHGSASDMDINDGLDTLTYVYRWLVNNRLISGENSSSLNLAKYPSIKPGDTITLEVRASDGTALSAGKTVSVTVGGATNSPSAGAA